MIMLTYVSTITLHRTTDMAMGVLGHSQPGNEILTTAEAVAYLEANPRNAIVITGLDEVSGECKPNGQVAVWCGAGEKLDNYYYQALPLDEPDADGGDLTAIRAIGRALDVLCS